MKIPIKKELLGKGIRLRKNEPKIELAKKIFKTVELNKNHLKKWFQWAIADTTLQDTLKYLEECEIKFQERKKVEYGIYLSEEFIGNIDFFNLDESNKSAEIGFWISSSFTRKGYATEALKILEKYLFNELNLNRIQIKCDSENIASQRVILKRDYKFEGILREYSYNNYFKEFRDKKIFSKLKSEFNESSK